MKKFAKNISEYAKIISKLQNSDGSFFSDSIDKNGLVKDKFRTIFLPALILDCLNGLDDDGISSMRKKIVKFLLSQKSREWSWNYWVKNTKEYKIYRIPDDMDDTMAVLAAILRFDDKIIKPADLAKITKLLTNFEIKEGGPYQTWMIKNSSDKKWLDQDIAVNAQIGYFLSLLEIELPNLTKFFDKKISRSDLKSKYYPDDLVTMYYLSRFYAGRHKSKLIQLIKTKIKTSNIQSQAMGVSALINLNDTTDLDKIIDAWNETDLRKPEKFPFCLDPSLNKKIYCMSSEALTLALVCEALNKYQKIKPKKAKHNKTNSNQYINAVISDFNGFINQISDSKIQRYLTTMLNKIMERDIDREIILFSKEFGQSENIAVPQKTIQQLSNANLCGWMAYTIYDDIMDSDAKVQLLPIANMMLIQTIKTFEDIDREFKNMKIREIYSQMLDTMESANFREINTLRFDTEKKLTINNLPKYSFSLEIANKSLPHIAGPMIIARINNWGNSDTDKLELMLKHYLTARQLNDDAHDISEDLTEGHLTYPAWLTLNDYFKKYEYFDSSKQKDIDKLLEILWTKSITKISKKIIESVNSSRKYQQKIKRINFSWLTNKLNKLEASAERAERESSDSIQYISKF